MVENGIFNTKFGLASLKKKKVNESVEKMPLIIQGPYFNMI